MKYTFIYLCLVTAALGACGGGAGTDGLSPKVAVTGQVSKGHVANATICAYKLVNGVKGDKIACSTTDSSANYTLSVPEKTEYVIEATGGTYLDEATGTNQTLSTTLLAVGQSADAASKSSVAVVTPLTTAAALGDGTGLNVAKFKAQIASIAKMLGMSEFDLSKELATFDPANNYKATNKHGVALGAVLQMMADGKTLTEIIALLKNATPTADAYAAFNAALKKYTANKGVNVAVSPSTSATSSTKTCQINSSTTETMLDVFPNPSTTTTTQRTICVVGVPSEVACSKSRVRYVGMNNILIQTTYSGHTESPSCTGDIESFAPPNAGTCTWQASDGINNEGQWVCTGPVPS